MLSINKCPKAFNAKIKKAIYEKIPIVTGFAKPSQEKSTHIALIMDSIVTAVLRQPYFKIQIHIRRELWRNKHLDAFLTGNYGFQSLSVVLQAELVGYQLLYFYDAGFQSIYSPVKAVCLGKGAYDFILI